MENEIVDTEKAKELVNHLNNMSANEIGYAFENMNYDGLLNLNCIIAHVLLNIALNVMNQLDKSKH